METFLIALLATLAGAYIALHKFKQEKVWQEKLIAYKEILNAIEGLRHWANETYCDCLGLPKIGLNEGKSFYKSYAEARMCISKYTSTGRLIIPKKIADELEELNTLIWQQDFVFEDTPADETNYQYLLANHAQAIQNIINNRLEKIIRLSRIDLS